MSRSRAVNEKKKTVLFDQETENSLQQLNSENLGSQEFKMATESISPELIQEKSQILLEEGQYKESYELINSLDTKTYDLRIIEAKALYGMDSKAKALEILEDLKTNDCTTIQRANELDEQIAQIYLDQAKFNDALKLYKLLVKYNNSLEDALKSIWLIYEVTGNFKESIDYHNQLLEKDSFNQRAWYNLGHAYRNSKNYEEAIHAFDMCSTLDENNADANWFLALSLKEKGEYAQAIEVFNKHYEQTEAKEGNSYIELAECYLALENYHFTFYYANRYQLDNRDNWLCYMYKGLSLVHFTNHKEAVKNYKNALQLKANEASIHINLGLAYYHLGNHKKAFSHMMEAMEQEPENVKYWLTTIGFLIKHEELKSAMHLCDNVTEIFDDKRALVYKAICYFVKGDTINAYTTLENINEMNAKDFSLILGFCPSLYDNKQFFGFYRFCINSTELPGKENIIQDLPDGIFQLSN